MLALDGFQGLKFGTPAERVVANLTRLLGPPTRDSGPGPAQQSRFGVCAGRTARTMGWGGLSVLFTDERGSMGFEGWIVSAAQLGGSGARPVPALTANGIRVGSSVRELRAAYGRNVEVYFDDLLREPAFTIHFPGQARKIYGTLTSQQSTGTVKTIENYQCGE